MLWDTVTRYKDRELKYDSIRISGTCISDFWYILSVVAPLLRYEGDSLTTDYEIFSPVSYIYIYGPSRPLFLEGSAVRKKSKTDDPKYQKNFWYSTEATYQCTSFRLVLRRLAASSFPAFLWLIATPPSSYGPAEINKASLNKEITEKSTRNNRQSRLFFCVHVPSSPAFAFPGQPSPDTYSNITPLLGSSWNKNSSLQHTNFWFLPVTVHTTVTRNKHRQLISFQSRVGFNLT